MVLKKLVVLLLGVCLRRFTTCCLMVSFIRLTLLPLKNLLQSSECLLPNKLSPCLQGRGLLFLTTLLMQLKYLKSLLLHVCCRVYRLICVLIYSCASFLLISTFAPPAYRHILSLCLLLIYKHLFHQGKGICFFYPYHELGINLFFVLD